MYTQLHQNDLREHAEQLHLPIKEFDRLLHAANYAHTLLKTLGPFYGREDIQEPTFRITAEPVRLPIEAKELLTDLGNDILHLGKALQHLPEKYRTTIGKGLDFRIPITWRIDTILDKENHIRVNEIEGIDSVSALMMAEQLAYHLQSMDETTIAQFVMTLKSLFPKKDMINLAIIRSDLLHNPFTPNAHRFIEFLTELSKDTITCDLYDIGELKNKLVHPAWEHYDAIMNEAYGSPYELQTLGIPMEKLITAGNYNALVNKGLYALFFEPKLKTFWKTEMGEERYERLHEHLIPSTFITSVSELRAARKEGKVAKVTWAEDNIIVINRCKGIAMPGGDILESEDTRWELLEDFLNQDYKIIAQDYVEPRKIFAYLRKRGTTLEPVEWYNRICVKYIVSGNPNEKEIPSVSLTATEVTLGPEIIPAGRKCAFTAGSFI